MEELVHTKDEEIMRLVYTKDEEIMRLRQELQDALEQGSEANDIVVKHIAAHSSGILRRNPGRSRSLTPQDGEMSKLERNTSASANFGNLMPASKQLGSKNMLKELKNTLASKQVLRSIGPIEANDPGTERKLKTKASKKPISFSQRNIQESGVKPKFTSMPFQLSVT
jgi:hypothetical protein